MMAAVLLLLTPSAGLASHDEVVIKNERFPTELVSVGSHGRQGSTGDLDTCGSEEPSISDGGRYVAFTSHSHLHPADVNGGLLSDVYIRDRRKGTTELVSISETGLAPTGDVPGLPSIQCIAWSFNPAISSNGRYVAFASYGVLNGENAELYNQSTELKVYVRDLKKHRTEIASPAINNDPSHGNSGTTNLSISRDGRFVVFESNAGNLVEKETCDDSLLNLGCQTHIFVRDRQENRTRLLSHSSDGLPGNDTSRRPFISDNGRFVVFESLASNLSDKDLNNCQIYGSFSTSPSCKDVFLYDLQKGEVELISVNRDGTAGNMNSWLHDVGFSQTISSDGRFVAFETSSSDLIPVGTLGETKLIVRDRKTGRNERVSVSSVGRRMGGVRPSISDNGRYVHWGSYLCAPLAMGPCESHGHDNFGSYVHNRKTGQTDLVRIHHHDLSGVDALGMLEGKGRYMVWPSTHEGYVDDDANGPITDVFLRYLGESHLGTGLKAQTDKGRGQSESGPIKGGVVQLTDAPNDALEPSRGAEILGARVIHRPEMGDLYFRLDLERLPVVTGTGLLEAPLVYGASFRTYDGDYQIRMAGSIAGLGVATDPAFGLFRRIDGRYTEVGRLTGSYGTVGESVTVSVPETLIGHSPGDEVHGLHAFSALGTYLQSIPQILDVVNE